MRGAINAVVILLLADFAWHLVRAWIDRRLAEVSAAGEAAADEIRHRARLRTLLPILRNALLVVLIVMAVLMALSALGVEVGPLIAGAGVVGVAIGFGAQTLVKDIISGMFLPARRRLSGRRVHHQRQLQRHGRVVLAAPDQAAPPRGYLYTVPSGARRDPEHEPRLGDRQDDRQRRQ